MIRRAREDSVMVGPSNGEEKQVVDSHHCKEPQATWMWEQYTRILIGMVWLVVHGGGVKEGGS